MKKELSPEHKAFMSTIIVNPLFKGAMREIYQQLRPVVPVFKPGQSREEDFALLERIKFETGRKDGFDLFYFHLTGERNE